MNKLYIFAIGGTGSRVLRSLTMMLASGVKLGVDTIVPIIIDPDTANADLTRTVTLMNDYTNLNRSLKFSSGSENRFFKTSIEKKQKDYTLPFDNIGGVSFESFLEVDSMDREDQALVRMLFSQKNLDSQMDVGFKGNPNIGSVVLNQIFDSEEFGAIANSFSDGDEIFIISSIFGGTGASGFPMLLKSLRTSDKFTNSALINKTIIGAVTLLPYFKVAGSNDETKEIKSGTFISKAKSALSYYGSNIVSGDAAVDDLYFLGDDVNDKVYEYSEGGSTQKNNAHLIEFLAATAIVDFTLRQDKRGADDPVQTNNHELGIRDLEGQTSVHFSSFYDGLDNMLYYPLTQFSMMANTFKEDYSYLTETLAATKSLSDFYSSSFIKNLKSFMDKYQEWLKEMDGNVRALQLFNFDCGKKPFNLINGEVGAKSHWYSLKKDYEVVEASLNSNSGKAKEVEKDSNPSMFLEMFSRATKELIKKKLNH